MQWDTHAFSIAWLLIKVVLILLLSSTTGVIPVYQGF